MIYNLVSTSSLNIFNNLAETLQGNKHWRLRDNQANALAWTHSARGMVIPSC